MGARKKTKVDMKAEASAVIAAFAKYYPAGGSLTLSGQVVAIALFVQMLKDLIAAIDASNAATTARRNAVADERAKLAALRPLLKALKSLVINQFGASSQAMTDFGFAAAPPSPSVATKAAALAKSRATREARKTMGKRQMAKVHGVPTAPAPSGSAGTPAKS